VSSGSQSVVSVRGPSAAVGAPGASAISPSRGVQAAPASVRRSAGRRAVGEGRMGTCRRGETGTWGPRAHPAGPRVPPGSPPSATSTARRYPSASSTLLAEEGAAAVRRAAAARVARLHLRRVPLGRDEVVVERDLLAGLDVPDGVDVDVAVLGDGLAVGVARVVDPAGDVALARAVDHRIVVEHEEEGVVGDALLPGVAPVAFLV